MITTEDTFVASLVEWRNWHRARALARLGRYRDFRVASAAERARARRLFRRVLRLLEPDSALPPDDELRARASRLTRLHRAPPVRRLWSALQGLPRAPRRTQLLVLGVTAVIVAALLWYNRVGLGLVKNLALGSNWRASSTYAALPISGQLRPNSGTVFFHTAGEPSPSITIDLGTPRTFSQLRAVNRVDCCKSRPIPLVLEVSDDRAHWRQVLRHELPFGTLTRRFPSVTARFARLRVDRPSFLHLNEIGLYR